MWTLRLRELTCDPGWPWLVWRAFQPRVPFFSYGALASVRTITEGEMECLEQESRQTQWSEAAGTSLPPGTETCGQVGTPLFPSSLLSPSPPQAEGSSRYKAGEVGKWEVLGTTLWDRGKLQEKGVWGILTLGLSDLFWALQDLHHLKTAMVEEIFGPIEIWGSLGSKFSPSWAIGFYFEGPLIWVF